MTKLVSLSTGRYFAQEAWKLRMYRGLAMTEAKTKEGVKLSIDYLAREEAAEFQPNATEEKVRPMYVVSWKQVTRDGHIVTQSHFIRVAKNWV